MQNFLKGALVGGIGATLVLMGSAALAGTGIGSVFNLGQNNTVNKASVLAGTTGGDQLDVLNSSTASNATAGTFLGKSATAGALRAYNTGGGPALALGVAAGKPPFTTNSATKVTNLNADKLDGLDSGAFARVVPLVWQGMAFHCFTGPDDPVSCAEGWNPVYGPVAPTYSKDAFGLVHLRGNLDCESPVLGYCNHSGGHDTMLTLPPGFRPAAPEDFTTTSGAELVEIKVFPNGAVADFSGPTTDLSVSGIAFSAG